MKDFDKVLVIFAFFFVIALLAILLSDTFYTKKVNSVSSIGKNRPIIIEENLSEKSEAKPIKGIAQEEAKEPIKSNSYISIETLEEKHEKIVSKEQTLYDIVSFVCESYSNVRVELVLAMIETESEGKSQAQNGNHIGLMQINKIIHAERASSLGVEDLFDPYGNVLVGVDYFNDLLNTYGDEGAALVAYNTGSYKGELTGYAKRILQRSYELSSNTNE